METLRGFPEFMRALPSAFNKIEDLEVIIAGSDRCAYSYPAPDEKGSWKDYMLKEIEGSVPIEKIKFVGLLSYPDYRKLLWRSNLHCYFTRPYVTSWSLFEAASCGARLLASTGKATEDICINTGGLWINLEDQESINTTIQTVLQPSERGKIERSVIKKGFGLRENLAKWEYLLNSCFK